ncbi:hypothetical protein TRFO_17576 [Tritrichomonas foetus]|uniref:DUF4200 domain-containing protein n=1 Tax=Tritrichomonas foetus TaxID=1144522 RepID=A0A1J4KN37_9EUKA|nr:hypothetical protein TRFO_17576 [Tritrichomonas foetus]|eukprot:OHT12530.1 hypothetical protein TRFO_17576 [Tritrichomonas foetus]
MFIDDLDEPLSELLQYTERRLPSTEQRPRNPFKLPPPTDSFGYREQNKRELAAERERMRKMTLVQRTDSLKPSIPSCVTQKTRANSVMSGKSTVRSESHSSIRFEKHQRTTEFIQQKREIYIVQMLIDRKNVEISKLTNQMKNEEVGIVETEQKIAQQSQKIKLMTAKCEARLARARKKAENAIRKRVELQKQYKQVLNSVSIMRSEILKNEETLESYQRYYDFLNALKPKDCEIFDYFTRPNKLIDEMNEHEKKNLFIIEKCQYFDNQMAKNVKKIQKDIDSTDNTINGVNKSLSDYHRTRYIDSEVEDKTEGNMQYSNQLDDELARLKEQVRRVYSSCLKKESDMGPIIMLEEIESNLHLLQTKIINVLPSFVAEKQAIKDKERREKQRKEKQEQQAIEQAKKTKQTLERANRPIKKKTGRPIIGRAVLIKHEKKDDAKLIRQRLEQQRVEQLLYGSPYE